MTSMKDISFPKVFFPLRGMWCIFTQLACRCNHLGECLVSGGRLIVLCKVRAYSSMSRDTLNYPKPDEFLPERFLASDKVTETPPDNPSFGFGFGRRIL
ncbi:hypothetical protein J3R82DRAFT_11535 [Butyriboletus roseoflavus]|nr:hypothetical protein J3R82DRAFT_11535 [Butyriboletus roseoflavus]